MGYISKLALCYEDDVGMTMLGQYWEFQADKDLHNTG